MQQRLGLAMALVGEPDLLILDEPFSGLDPHGTRLVREIVEEENESGTSIFFSSHVLDQVERVCDRVGLLANGELIAEGTPEQVRSDAGVDSRLILEFEGEEIASEQVVDRARKTDGVATAEMDDRGLIVTCTNSNARPKVLQNVESIASVQTFNVEPGIIEDAFVANTET